MPLRQLADEIIRLNQRYRSTPVLVTPSYLSLRKQFFLALVRSLAEQTERPIRIDWYRGMPSLFSLVGDRIASVRVAAINRGLACLTSDLGTAAEIQITGLIARPTDVEQELVIGLCDQRLTLPTWGAPIRLGASPTELAID